jgi:hypothetical protein
MRLPGNPDSGFAIPFHLRASRFLISCTARILGSGAACNKAKATEYQYRGSGAHRARRAVFRMAAAMWPWLA